MTARKKAARSSASPRKASAAARGGTTRKKQTGAATPRKRRVFFFGNGKAHGRTDMRELLVDGFQVPMGAPELVGETLIDVAHSGKIALVDGEGAIRGYFSYDEEGLDEVFQRSRELLTEEFAS